MEALALHTGAPAVYQEDNKICISVVKAKIFNLRVKTIDIPVCLIQAQTVNGIFIPRYEKSSDMPEDMCTKPCSGSIISLSTKLMTGFRLYPSRDTAHYQLMRLHEFVAN